MNAHLLTVILLSLAITVSPLRSYSLAYGIERSTSPRPLFAVKSGGQARFDTLTREIATSLRVIRDGAAESTTEEVRALTRSLLALDEEAGMYFDGVYSECRRILAPILICQRAKKARELVHQRIQQRVSELIASRTSQSESRLSDLLDEIAAELDPLRVDRQFGSLPVTFMSQPRIQSYLGRLSFASSPVDPSDPSYLQSSDEALQTADIIALAASLENEATQIFEWVYENTVFSPGFGAMRGSQSTLIDGAGNAFDISSLLVALLRASDVPSRYAFGRVRLSRSQLLEMVPAGMSFDEATSVLADSGIPITIVTANGIATACEFDHVWVQAFVPSHPSRGQVARGAKQWVDLDAALKPVTYQDPVVDFPNFETIPAAVLSEIDGLTQVDGSSGEVTSLPIQLLEDALNDGNQQVVDAVSQAAPEASPVEVVGELSVSERLEQGLPPSFRVQRVTEYAISLEIPDELRFEVEWSVRTVGFLGTGGAEVLRFRGFASAVHGSEVLLRFDPSTEEDAQALSALLPTDLDDPADLPNSVPGGLVEVIGRVSVNGIDVEEGGAVQLGEALKFELSVIAPDERRFPYEGSIVAGEHLALAYVAGQMSQDRISSIESRAQSVSETLANAGQTALQKTQYIGPYLDALISTYFGVISSRIFVDSRSSGVVAQLLPSVGLAGTRLSTSFFFGVPRTVSSGGLKMDVGVLRVTVNSVDGSEERELSFAKTLGLQTSFFEHAAPEGILNGDSQISEGISAARALQLAVENDIPLFAIGEETIAGALQEVNLPDSVLDDIASAISAGHEVLVPQTAVEFHGVDVVGYIVFDPVTGSGGYFVDVEGSGTTSGAFLAILIAFAWVFGPILAGIVGGTVLAVPVMTAFGLLFYGNLLLYLGTIFEWEGICNFGFGLSLTSLSQIPGAAVLLAVFGVSVTTLLQQYTEVCEFP